MIVSRLVVDVGIGIVPRGHVLTPAMGFFIRTVEDVTASMLSRVIDVGIGIVPPVSWVGQAHRKTCMQNAGRWLQQSSACNKQRMIFLKIQRRGKNVLK